MRESKTFWVWFGVTLLMCAVFCSQRRVSTSLRPVVMEFSE